MTVFWFLLYAQKERPGGEPYRFCTLQNQCPAARRSPAWPKNLLPTFLHRKVGPRRRAMLTIPLQKAPPAEGEMKLRHGFCQKSLRLISFATSLCTREAFAVRRLQTFPRRAGVLAKPCKRPAPPPGDHQLDLKSLCLLLFLSHQVCMDREKNRPTVFPWLRDGTPEFAGIRAEHLSDHGKSGKSPAVSGERFCWTGPVRPL